VYSILAAVVALLLCCCVGFSTCLLLNFRKRENDKEAMFFRTEQNKIEYFCIVLQLYKLAGKKTSNILCFYT